METPSTRYPDAPIAARGTTIETGDWFQDRVRDVLEEEWGISPKSYHSKEYQIKKGEGKYAEYKHDPHTTYKHLSIEVGERTGRDKAWVVAGIFRTSCPYYIQGDEYSIWVFPTHMLKRYAGLQGVRVNWDTSNPLTSDVIDERGICSDYNGTLFRFFLEYEDAESIGGIRIDCG